MNTLRKCRNIQIFFFYVDNTRIFSFPWELKLITLRLFPKDFPFFFRDFSQPPFTAAFHTSFSSRAHTDTCCQTTTHATIKKLLFFWQTNFPPCHEPSRKNPLKANLKAAFRIDFRRRTPLRLTLISTKTPLN